MSGVRGKFVRRIDATGRPYYVKRSSNKRVAAAKWKQEREQIAHLRRAGITAVQIGQIPPEGSVSPFPTTAMGVPVTPRGVPTWIDQFGVEREIPAAIEGDDETG